MSGIRLVLDTNAINSLIRGNTPLDSTNKADFVGISIIGFIEFLSFLIFQKNDRHYLKKSVKKRKFLISTKRIIY